MDVTTFSKGPEAILEVKLCLMHTVEPRIHELSCVSAYTSPAQEQANHGSSLEVKVPQGAHTN